MFGLGTLLEASLLFLNAVAVLHEERFLKKFGLADDSHQGFGEPGMKQQIIKFINSVRTVMRGESKNLSSFFQISYFYTLFSATDRFEYRFHRLSDATGLSAVEPFFNTKCNTN